MSKITDLSAARSGARKGEAQAQRGCVGAEPPPRTQSGEAASCSFPLLTQVLTTERANQGSSTLWLTVLEENAPAFALYSGLGFETHDVTTTWWKKRG